MRIRRSITSTAVAMGMAVIVGGTLAVGAAGAGAASTGVITTIAGNGTLGNSGNGAAATSAMIDQPNGVVYDKAGNLYISDANSNVVRKVSPSGTISPFAGTGTAGNLGDGAAATSAQLANPHGLAVDSAGNVYIADTNNNRVREVLASNGNIVTFAGAVAGIAGNTGDGALAALATLNHPQGVTVDGTGRVLIADTTNNRVRRVGTDLMINNFAGSAAGTAGSGGDGGAATSAGLSGPVGVALDANQNVVITDSGNNTVRRVDATTSVITKVAGTTGTSTSTGNGGPATAATLSNPTGIVVDNANSIFVAENNGDFIRRIGANGVISAVAGDGSGNFNGDNQAAVTAEVNAPNQLAISPASDLVIADGGNHRVRDIAGIASQGYYMAAGDGGVFTHGSALFYGSEGALKLNKPVVTMAATPTKQGYWLFAADGGVFTHGDAKFFGSEGALQLVKPIVGAASTPDGKGYWLFASDGGVFTHGDAGFFGSEGALKHNQPIVAAASTPTGKGYWLFAADGGVFTHGDAGFFGSEGALKLNQPIVAGASTPSGQGYWLFAADGGVFTHGDAKFFGSEGALKLNTPIVASATTPPGTGYWLFASDGGVFTHGDAG
ncbi:MAG: S-layer protein, partial [Actinomycetia bacterium]|nr:S-layer protein [Actinomycetes bacterium]